MFNKNTQLQPRLLHILLCQWVDLSLGALLSLGFFLIAGFNETQFFNLNTWLNLSSFSAFSFLCVLCTFVIKVFSILFFGHTMGTKISHVQSIRNNDQSTYWIEHFLESFYLIVPALWLWDFFGRIAIAPHFGMKYVSPQEQ